MDGTAELQQLTHLLRVGADAARQIALVRSGDARDIRELATQADAMSDDIDRIITAAPIGSEIELPA